MFWSGVIYLALTFTRFREKIIDAIPDMMKSALSLCVGVFLMLIALRIAGIAVYEGIIIKGIGTVLTPLAFVFLFGLALVLVLRRFRIPGAVLISIILAGVFAHFIGLGNTSEPIVLSSDMFSAVLGADLGVILDPRIFSVILVLFIVDFYGSVAKFIGLSRKTSIVNKKGRMPDIKEAMAVDGSSNILGSVLGRDMPLSIKRRAEGLFKSRDSNTACHGNRRDSYIRN